MKKMNIMKHDALSFRIALFSYVTPCSLAVYTPKFGLTYYVTIYQNIRRHISQGRNLVQRKMFVSYKY